MIKLFALALTAAALVPASAGAQTLFEGKAVEASYRFPSQNAVYQNFGTRTITGPTLFSTNLGNVPGVALTVSDHNVLVNFTNAVTWTSLQSGVSFNGFNVTDVNGTINPFTSFTINSATNTSSGFSASNLSFDGNNLFVNWAGLSFSSGDVLSLDVNQASVGSAVPEPATWAMMIMGFGMVGYGLRRRQNKVMTKVCFA